MFLSTRACHGANLDQVFRRQTKYRVDAFDLKKKALVSQDDVDEAFLTSYEVQRRSIYVGGLPIGVREAELVALFSEIGTVLNTQIINKSCGG